jgi:hypothetical protein
MRQLNFAFLFCSLNAPVAQVDRAPAFNQEPMRRIEIRMVEGAISVNL